MLAPTYDIHVNFNPHLLGGIFEKASLGNMIEIKPMEAVPVSRVKELLSPLIELMVEECGKADPTLVAVEDKDLLREMKSAAEMPMSSLMLRF